MKTPRRSLPVVVSSIFVATLLLALPAAAEEPNEAKEMVALIAELRGLEDAAGLMEALGQLPDVYRNTTNKGLRSKLRREMGKVLTDEDLGDARMAAVDAFLTIEDPKVSWKEVSKAMPSPKVAEATPLDLALVRAAGHFAQSRAIGTLLDLAAKAKDNRLAKTAAEALAGYREDRRNRVKVLEELLSLGKRVRPGTAPDKPVSVEAQKRWEVVGQGILLGLNNLTGQILASFEEWEVHYKEFKKQPQELFLED